MHRLARSNHPRGLAYCFLFFFHLSFCCPDWMISIVLAFRSLVHSSVLFSLLLIAFSSVFVLANEFLNFCWLLFIVSTSLLQ